MGDGGIVRFWNGTTWGSQNSLVTTQLNSVFAANSTNVWAVGTGGVVRKYGGSTWSGQTSASGAGLELGVGREHDEPARLPARAARRW